jgi:uncharacterized membrane protein HdeD (DUF308 family)
MNKLQTLLMVCFAVLFSLAALATTNHSFGLTPSNGWPLYLVIPGVFSLIAAFTLVRTAWLAYYSVYSEP